jgi:hypothetical protein
MMYGYERIQFQAIDALANASNHRGSRARIVPGNPAKNAMKIIFRR